jgi:TolB-like protein
MKPKILISILLFVVLLGPHLTNAAISPRIAVTPFENINKDSSLDWLSAGIPETVTNSLSSVKGIVLVERIQLRKVMDELNLQHSGIVDEKTAVKLGKLIAANILVIGAFQKSGETVRLTARFLDVESGKILHTAQATGNLNDIFNLQDKIVLGLVKNLNIEISQDERTKLTTAPTESLDAYRHFGQGALLEAKKDYPGALKELQKAKAADPKFTLATKKFTDIFLSLNKGNYWTYEETTNMFGDVPNIQSHGFSIEKAGGNELFNGMSVFSYITGGAAQSSYVGNIQHKVTTYYEKKDDGIYTVGAKSENITKEDRYIYITIIEPPYLVYPYDMVIGQKWEVNSVFKIEGTSSSASKYEGKREVINRETITVPAGTFDCFVIEGREEFKGKTSGFFGTGYTGKTIVTTWFAQGVGTIKTRTKMETSGVTLVTERVLKEYHVEE